MAFLLWAVLWILPTNNAWAWILAPAAEGSARFVEDRGGMRWVGTSWGFWRLIKADAKPELVAEVKANFVRDYGGVLWLGTEEGVYRCFDAKASVVKLKAAKEANWWERVLSLLLPNVIVGTQVVPEVKYNNANVQSLLGPDQYHFMVIIAADPEELRQRLELDDFHYVGTPQRFSIGYRKTVHVAIKDKWDNLYEETIEQTVLPSAETLAILLPLALIIFMLLALVGSPYLRSCRSLIMNPFARIGGSFGLVPLLLTLLPLARRHVLKRYRRALGALTVGQKNVFHIHGGFVRMVYQPVISLDRRPVSLGHTTEGMIRFLRL